LRQELLRSEKKQKDAAIKQYRAFIAAHSAYDVVRDRVEKARADLLYSTRQDETRTVANCCHFLLSLIMIVLLVR